jgi:hypothetical protein
MAGRKYAEFGDEAGSPVDFYGYCRGIVRLD